MKIKGAVILRKSIDGKLLILGSSLEIPIEIIDDNEYLILGEFEFKPKNIFHEYKYDKGNSPDNLLSDKNANGGALNWRNYKNKLL